MPYCTSVFLCVCVCVLRFLNRNQSKLGSLGKATVEELGMISRRVEGVHPETPAIEAMNIMSKK